MDSPEKICKAFSKIVDADQVTNHLVFDFLKELYHHVNEGIFVIPEKEDFTVKHVEGMTFFDAHSRTLHVGNDVKDTRTALFETLVSMMQFYDYLGEHPGEGHAFKNNPEQKLALEYTAAAITRHVTGDFQWPEPALEAIMREHGLIDELAVIQAFSKRLVKQVEFEGDFLRLLEKLKETISIFHDVTSTSPLDETMQATLGMDGGISPEDEEKEREAFLRTLLDGLSLD